MELHRFSPPRPVSLPLTLAPLRLGRFDPTLRLAPREAWRAWHTPEGPVTLHLTDRDGDLEARAFGRGAGWALARTPALVGSGDHARGFAPDHPTVARLHRRLPGLALGACGHVGDVLVQTVLAQKVASAEAVRCWGRLVRRFGRPAPGPGDLFLPPPARELAGLPYERLHPVGIERRRATTIARACALLCRKGDLPAGHLATVPGIGPWTVALLHRAATGDPDTVEPGDYNLPHLVAWNLAGEARADDTRMLELLAPFAGQRGRVVRLLRAGGRRPPRFGPRRPLRRVTAI